MKSIAIIGSGRMARFLAQRLHTNYRLLAIVARNVAMATSMSRKYKCTASSISDFNINQVDIAIIAVSDDAILPVIKMLGKTSTTIIHTSGTKALVVLESYTFNCGVLWPVVSVNDNAKYGAQFNCSYEGSNTKTKREVLALAKALGAKPFYQSSVQREVSHLAAVMVNNFVNHIYHKANAVLLQHDIKPEIIYQIIRATAENAIVYGAENLQTGPALRKDKTTMQRHLQLIKEYPELCKIYKAISESIMHSSQN
ncbi:MAG: DUF2520 domain-containing protein [Bacteroidetes bacterium]|nr:DUF2520 domain-containing protein [Bacteroidota bacterium]